MKTKIKIILNISKDFICLFIHIRYIKLLIYLKGFLIKLQG